MTNPYSNELLATFARVPGVFNPKPLNNAYNGLIGNVMSTGQQLANNAGQEYLGRAQQSGASTLGAGVAQAQAYLPFLQQSAQLRTQQVKDSGEMRQQGLGLQAQIAGQLASLRQNYANYLANNTQQQQQFGLQQQQFGLQRDQFGLQQLQANRQWALQRPVQTTNFDYTPFDTFHKSVWGY